MIETGKFLFSPSTNYCNNTSCAYTTDCSHHTWVMWRWSEFFTCITFRSAAAAALVLLDAIDNMQATINKSNQA